MTSHVYTHVNAKTKLYARVNAFIDKGRYNQRIAGENMTRCCIYDSILSQRLIYPFDASTIILLSVLTFFWS